MREADRAALLLVIAAVRGAALAGRSPARLYLLARTSQLAEGWVERVPHLELAGDGASALEAAAREAARLAGVDVVWESPADVIPLPEGWEERSRPAPPAFAGRGASLEVLHFDPYSVVMRLVARGDEPDYVMALEYLRHGWVDMARLESLLSELLPRFTRGTLAQDPAEFRRKFRGLRQVAASASTRTPALGFTAATWA